MTRLLWPALLALAACTSSSPDSTSPTDATGDTGDTGDTAAVADCREGLSDIVLIGNQAVAAYARNEIWNTVDRTLQDPACLDSLYAGTDQVPPATAQQLGEVDLYWDEATRALYVGLDDAISFSYAWTRGIHTWVVTASGVLDDPTVPWWTGTDLHDDDHRATAEEWAANVLTQGPAWGHFVAATCDEPELEPLVDSLWSFFHGVDPQEVFTRDDVVTGFLDLPSSCPDPTLHRAGATEGPDASVELWVELTCGEADSPPLFQAHLGKDTVLVDATDPAPDLVTSPLVYRVFTPILAETRPGRARYITLHDDPEGTASHYISERCSEDPQVVFTLDTLSFAIGREGSRITWLRSAAPSWKTMAATTEHDQNAIRGRPQHR